MTTCFLCKYHNTPDTKRILAYISDNAGKFGLHQMALAIHEDISTLDPDTGLDSILEHLTSHTLFPGIRVSLILRRLHNVEETLSTTLMSKDEEGNAVVDGKNVQVYLKVISEILTIYKAGDRLMYSDIVKAT